MRVCVCVCVSGRVLYDRACMIWNLLGNILAQLPGGRGGRDFRVSLFWSAHQRFYKCLLMAAKVWLTAPLHTHEQSIDSHARGIKHAQLEKCWPCAFCTQSSEGHKAQGAGWEYVCVCVWMCLCAL